MSVETMEGRLSAAVAAVVRWATRADSREALHGVGDSACSPTDAWLLQGINENGPVRMSILADWQGVDRSTMTTQIRRLAERGLVRRKADPTDARGVLIELTPRGKDMVSEEQSRAEQVFAEAISDWNPKERADLSRLLTRLAERLQGRG